MSRQRVNVNVDGTMVVAGLIVAGALVLYWKRQAIADALNKVNPASSNNVVNEGVSSVVKNQTGCKDLGRYLWCLSHTDRILCAGCAGQ